MEMVDFNSSMVRLKEMVVNALTGEYVKFQFLNGAIKRPFEIGLPETQDYFNSSMVRLKVSIVKAIKIKMPISIPQWCD